MVARDCTLGNRHSGKYESISSIEWILRWRQSFLDPLIRTLKVLDTSLNAESSFSKTLI